MSDMKKSAYRITAGMIEEMLKDYIKKHEGKNVDSLHLTLDLPNDKIDVCRHDLSQSHPLHVFTATWED